VPISTTLQFRLGRIGFDKWQGRIRSRMGVQFLALRERSWGKSGWFFPCANRNWRSESVLFELHLVIVGGGSFLCTMDLDL